MPLARSSTATLRSPASCDNYPGTWGYYGVGVGHATRASVTDVWVVQGQETFVHSNFSVDGGPWISPDQLTLMFSGTDTATDMMWHEYQTTRTSITAAWAAAIPVPLAHTAQGEAYGSLRGDQLEIVFETETTSQLFHATRAAATDNFNAAVALSELNQQAYLFGDPDLSEDGTTLWFASTRPGGVGDYDLWTVTRTCL